MTQTEAKRILWVDDEIDLLQPHIIFLRQRRYEVTPVSNGDAAIEMCRRGTFDLVLLDEMMPGRDGLSTLAAIADIRPNLPAVMITKNEAEQLMDEAIGQSISDYLIKPVSPMQVLSACRRILDARRIQEGRAVRAYTAGFSEIQEKVSGSTGWRDWVDVHRTLSDWDVAMDSHRDTGLKQTQRDQRRTCNAGFGDFVENRYREWIEDAEDRPLLSVDVVRSCVAPHLDDGGRVYFIVIDCMRLDQWLSIEPLVAEYFSIKRDYGFSILPTATPYSRNALFSGLFPEEIARMYPELWNPGRRDDTSLNRFERQLMDAQLERLGIALNPEPKYVKVLDADEARTLPRHIQSRYDVPLTSMVFNFVDNLAHGRSESEILQEIAPDEAGFRSLTRSWFQHSALFEILRTLSRRDCTIVLTSDHGAVLGMRGTRAVGDRDTSTNLRYKYGNQIDCDRRHAMMIEDPEAYRLPRYTNRTNYIIAREDYYFVYPNRFQAYREQYKDSFQHGGISMEEMIVPILTLRPRHAGIS